MKCEDLLPLQGAYLDSELGAKTSLEIQQHLATCPDCARAFAAEAKLDARIAGGLKRGQRTSAFWEQIEQRIAASAAPVSSPADRSGVSVERRNPFDFGFPEWRRSAESPPRRLERTPAESGHWWHEWLWPCPQAWAGLGAAWMVALAASLAAREPAPVTETHQTVSPSPQLRQMLRQQRQMLAELNGLTEPLGTESLGGASTTRPHSQRGESRSNT